MGRRTILALCLAVAVGLWMPAVTISYEAVSMLKLKAGVNARHIQPEINLAIQVVTPIYKEFGYDTIVTSLHDGKHMPNSLHTRGGICRAVDFRTKHLSVLDKSNIVSTVKAALGKQYQVKFESEGLPNEHLHVEFDPPQNEMPKET